MRNGRRQPQIVAPIAAVGLAAVIFGAIFFSVGHPKVDLASIAPSAPFRVDVAASLGADQGQNLGTLFQTLDDQGELLCEAGFYHGAHSTVTLPGKTLEFRCRTSEEARVVDLGRPSTDVVRPHVLSVGGRLVERETSQWLIDGHWASYGDALPIGVRSTQDVSGGLLVFSRVGGNISVTYDGDEVLSAEGDFKAGIFYRGSVFVAMRTPEDGMVLERCDWTPGSTCNQRERMSLWAEGDDIYAAVPFGDSVVFGHWPSGAIYRREEDTLVPVATPPLLPGQYSDSEHREAQSLIVSGGRVSAGMYPWGAVSSMSPSGDWQNLRTFQFPQVSDEICPYFSSMESYRQQEAAVGAEVFKWAEYTWCQRITSMQPIERGFAVAQGNMPGLPFDPIRDAFMSPEARAEYGAIKEVVVPGSLNVAIEWRERTVLSFAAGNGALQVYQDGVLLGEAPFVDDMTAPRNVVLGMGSHGPFGGDSLDVAS